MHGIIFVELKKYVQSKVGPGTWETLLAKSGLTRTSYLITSVYPDEEMVALVTTASSLTGTAIPAMLEDFGEFLVPGLIKTYRSFLRPDWRTLDTIEHTEANIHKAVAKGIARGIAQHYGERITLSESTCMLHGDRACTISVRLVGS